MSGSDFSDQRPAATPATSAIPAIPPIPPTPPESFAEQASEPPKQRHFVTARMVLMGQVLCTLLMFLPIVGYSAWKEGSAAREKQLEAMQSLVQGLASRQTTLAASTESLLLSMSLAPVMRSGVPEDVYRYLVGVDCRLPDFDGFAVFDAKGETVAGLYDGRPRVMSSENIRSREYFTRTMNSGGFHIDLALQLENERTILPMTLPLRDENGVIRGMLMASLSVSRNQSLMGHLIRQDTVGVFLFDAALQPLFAYAGTGAAGQGETLLHTQNLQEFLPRNAPVFVEGAPYAGNVFYLKNADGERYVGTATALFVGTDRPYMYITALDRELVWSEFIIQRYARQLIILSIGVVSVLWLSCRLGTRYFVLGIEGIADVARRAREGDLGLRCKAGPGCTELAGLRTDFNHMLASLEYKTDELRRLSVTDPLTGLWNRRHFTEVAHQDIGLAGRQGHSVCAVMADIDLFKRVNDTYGHAAGDTVLRQFATALRVNLRISDLLARYGGEEFILLLPATDHAGASVLLEKLRHITENLRVPLENGQEIRFTASFGAAVQTPAPGTSEDAFLAELQARADAALYLSKNSGRNKVTVA